MTSRFRVLLITALTVLVGAGTALAGVAATPGAASAATTPKYYLALGDSLAAGAGATPGSNAYVNRIYAHEATRFTGLALNNISCGGATTSSMLNSTACGKTVTQTAEAESFLRAHPGQVAFVTIDIGGNDASGCVGAGGVNLTCSANALAAIQTNLTTILSRLKTAYPGVRVYGMSYYIPSLAFWLTGASGQQVARDSVPAGKSLNNELTQIYAAAGFTTADVAKSFDNNNLAMTGSYNGLTVPQNVANLCNWTLVCSNNDVHANNIGHGKLADAFTTLIDQVPGSPLGISTPSLFPGKLGVPYVGILTASGGTAPYTWTRIGKLPKGLKLATNGYITGTPTKTTGTTTFQIRVKDSAKPRTKVTKTFSITIS